MVLIGGVFNRISNNMENIVVVVNFVDFVVIDLIMNCFYIWVVMKYFFGDKFESDLVNLFIVIVFV